MKGTGNIMKELSNRPERLLRLKQVLEIIPVSKSTWWTGVKNGKFPKPSKLSERTTVWRESDIRALVEALYNGNEKN
jgi:predicted DNA-binding transcriptional regulator AlpA